jgi:DNA mismatch endonuclease, patch repair protein
MRSNRPKDTSPELALRRELHARGLRYRIHRAPSRKVRTTADVLFSRARLAVYVDGCFWHSCPEHAVMPKRNRDFWMAKLRTNQERDRRTDELLAAEGWTVLRIWEHEDPAVGADAVERALRIVDERVRRQSADKATAPT